MAARPLERSFLDLHPKTRHTVYEILFSFGEVELAYGTGIWQRNPNQAANILRVCRQMYSEAAPVLYGENCFGAPSFRIMEDLSLKIGSRNTNLVRHVRLLASQADKMNGAATAGVLSAVFPALTSFRMRTSLALCKRKCQSHDQDVHIRQDLCRNPSYSEEGRRQAITLGAFLFEVRPR